MRRVWINLSVWGIALLLLGASAAVAVPAFADEHTPARSWPGTIRVKNLNVRGGPGEGYDIVAKLKRGDKVTAIDQSGRWVRVILPKPESTDDGAVDEDGKENGKEAPELESWIHRSFLNLPKDFMAPAFGDEENAFVDWAIDRGDLSELSIESTERLSVVLSAETVPARAALVAYEVGCAYREQLKINGPVTVTVWSEKGAAAGWLAQITCP
ncbi:MAG: SH3 domain-containing protein [Proteobacteria bacterium]|nr:SH3 domain-containing protein [Pseudomonadota bacterium]